MGTEPASRCLNENEVLAFMQGTLDGASGEATRAHLDTCPVCQELFSCLSATVSHVSAAGSRNGMAIGERGVLDPGTMVGRYKIVRPVGAGAMGVVYLADDLELGRQIAIKMLSNDDDVSSERLRREAQSLARLSHPNVIVVHEVGKFEDQVFMAMEFVEGCSLTEWCTGSRRSLDEVLNVFLQAARGLDVAHRAGLVHRDFKPDNVLVGLDGRVRVVDFGLARGTAADTGAMVAVGREQDGEVTKSHSLTRTGAFVGTPAYMAPEQLEGEVADARSDQFGFCVALFEAIWKERPFRANNLRDLAIATKAGDVHIPRGPVVPSRIERAILRGLHPKKEDRFASMSDLIRELETPTARSTKRALALVALVVLLVAAGTLRSVAKSATASQPKSARSEAVSDSSRMPAEQPQSTSSSGAPSAQISRVQASDKPRSASPERTQNRAPASPAATVGTNGAPILR